MTHQEKLGRMLYWGSNGVRRNLGGAIGYLRQAAQGPDANAANHFDYGVVLIKQKEAGAVETGKAELEKAGEKDPRALTALGWLHETKYRNLHQALAYYEKAAALGNADARYNLGVYYHEAPGQVVVKDKILAFRHFEKAATQGQPHSGAMYARYLLTGVGSSVPRNPAVALNWARFVAEQNPRLGRFLSEGVRAFRRRQISLSLFYYLLGAFSGLELAQFNTALLCEEHQEIAKRFIGRECQWYHYNASTQLREDSFIHAYSLIKMADRSWYGSQLGEDRNISCAVELYIRAAVKLEPQAYFNLGYIVEHDTLNSLDLRRLTFLVPASFSLSSNPRDSRLQMAITLYKKCEALSKKEEYIACRLAIQRLQLEGFWKEFKWIIQITVSIVMGCIFLCQSLMLWRGRLQPRDSSVLRPANGALDDV